MSYELFEALDEGDIETAKQLISAGEDVHFITENENWSYLHKILTEMVEKTPQESIQYLIDQGLDVNAVDSYGNTPLLYAVRQRNVDGMRLLLANGADRTVEHRNERGVNALKMAIYEKPFLYDVVKVLLDFGADPDAKTETGKSFRELANLLDDMDPKIKELVTQY